MFNVQEFLKTYALDVAAGHWDNYGANINNYYLYHNLATDKFEFLRSTATTPLGWTLGFDWTNQPIYDWPTGWYDVPLVTRLMEVDTYRAVRILPGTDPSDRTGSGLCGKQSIGMA